MERKKKGYSSIRDMAAASGGKASDHFINPNNWEEVIDFAKALGVTAKEFHDWAVKSKQPPIKTKPQTMQIGCLIYDTLKKKSKLTTRSRIINLRKKIETIEPKYKKFSDQKLYENANHAHKRTPSFVLWDSDVREDLF